MKRKLIEVALPLDAINRESGREKSIRHGHPSTLHLWWARRPLAACRAVLFASLVDDPSSHPDKFPDEVAQEQERKRLFGIMERLVKWENSNNPTVLEEARQEILKATDGNPPPVLDPFCGGGSIPLEAQRLGLEAHASDLNPVAVLITKSLIEIPPKFTNQPPINPDARKRLKTKKAWQAAQGLAEDVRAYGQWMRDAAEKRIGHLYPKVKLPGDQGGDTATVIAWIWARTVKCPNPACGAQMPLVRSFELSTRSGKRAWVEPQIDSKQKSVGFTVKSGKGEAKPGTVNRRGATCIVCNSPVAFEYIRAEGRAKRLRAQLMAVVAEGRRGRVYLDASSKHSEIAGSAEPKWKPEGEIAINPRNFNTPNYGLTSFGDLFTSRQLAALTTFSDLVMEARAKAIQDGAKPEYADAIATYLAFAVDKTADYSSNLCTWHINRETIGHLFTRQAIPMAWDFAETNLFSRSTGNFLSPVDWIARVLEALPSGKPGHVQQQDATTRAYNPHVFSTDPPYYDNIGYADLSDFFYVWLRRSLLKIYPDLFSTLLVPKAEELVATPYRFGGDPEKAREFFEDGFAKAFLRMRDNQRPEYPFTVFYAFKQSETEEEGTSDSAVVSTGWETMLAGLMQAEFQVTGTWPIRSELTNRPVASGANALASSIALVCRLRPATAQVATRKDFFNALKRELPIAVRTLQDSGIAPVDLEQAAIGPGMAVFSRYKKVLETNGKPMPVRTALSLINQVLDEILSGHETDLDPETMWALTWYRQYQYRSVVFGEAEKLATAKALSVARIEQKGLIASGAGKVRLLQREELDTDLLTCSETPTVWEFTQQLAFTLREKGGVTQAAQICERWRNLAEIARDLAYRLYVETDRKGWSEEAAMYNGLVKSWPAIVAERNSLLLSVA